MGAVGRHDDIVPLESSEWSYEREWRLIESIIAVNGNVEDPKPNWRFPLRFEIYRWKREHWDAPPPHQLEYVEPNP